MNLRTLARKNLLRRKSRALFTGLGIFLGIATFVTVSSLTMRMEGAVRDQLDRYGANILVTPRTDQLSLGFGDVALGGAAVARGRLAADDERAIRSIAMSERIRLAVPWFVAAADTSGKNVVWMGVRPADIPETRPWWQVDGAGISGPGEVVLGSEAAAALDKGPGGTVEAGGRTFRVAGVLRPTGEKEDGMVIADIGAVRALAGVPDGVTFFEVAALCRECPIEDIVKEIGDRLPGARVSAIRSVVAGRQTAVDRFRTLGLGVSALVLGIGGLMVFVTIMGNVQERTREIGILRAVGYRRGAIRSLLFWETGWIALCASIAGALAGAAASFAFSPLFGIARGAADPRPMVLGTALGVALGLLGAIPPARRAAALSPAEAIRSL
jgi:putative ABC transport system permease protein